MPVHDPFKDRTVFQDPDQEFVVGKNARIYGRGVPRLEAHGKSKMLSNKAFGLGRDKHNAVIILDEKVSKFHAVMTFDKGIAFIRDIHSTNGTFINGKRLVPNQPVKGGRYSVFKSRMFIRKIRWFRFNRLISRP
jgi:pSer/pThr/pTyr-binding forkhead associated (FHA) protein